MSSTSSCERGRSSSSSVSRFASGDADALRDRVRNEQRIEDGGEPDQRGAVLELRLDRPRELQREPRLADPARPRQRHQPHAAGEQRRRLGELAAPTDQRRRRRRQARHGPRGGGRRHRRVLLENGALEPLQLGARLDAELVHERLARPRELGQGVRLAAGAVEREHQLRPRPLAQRLRLDESLQLGDHLGVPAELEIEVDPVLQRRQPQLLQPEPVELRLAAPERERRTEPLGALRGRERLGLGAQLLEPGQVEIGGGDLDHVAGAPPLDHVVPERLPQLRDVDLERVLRRLRRLVAPERVRQAVDRDDVVRVQQQRRQQRARLRPADGHRPAVVIDLQRAQDPELHRRAFVPRFRVARRADASAGLQRSFRAVLEPGGVLFAASRKEHDDEEVRTRSRSRPRPGADGARVDRFRRRRVLPLAEGRCLRPRRQRPSGPVRIDRLQLRARPGRPLHRSRPGRPRRSRAQGRRTRAHAEDGRPQPRRPPRDQAVGGQDVVQQGLGRQGLVVHRSRAAA